MAGQPAETCAGRAAFSRIRLHVITVDITIRLESD
jgi:hypothetical protein